MTIELSKNQPTHFMKTKTNTAQERFDHVKALVNKVMEDRLNLIALTKQATAAANLAPEAMLNAVFTRNYTASHMKKWWGERSARLLEQFQEEDAYDSVAAKLTPEERRLLGVREPVGRRPKKKPVRNKPEENCNTGWSFK
jgi:hypothetical protein